MYRQGDRQLIDPRAVIDPKAEIAEGVEIGPFSIIGPGVSIGKGTVIGPHVVIALNTRIGEQNKIFQFASVGEDPQDKKFDGEPTELEIGDRNVIREYATIHRGTVQDHGLTKIGSDNLLMAYTHVAHDCQISDHTILANAASLGGHVKIEDYAILGGFTIVHQFCHIGTHCFCGMGSSINMDVPPYVMVAGQPAKPHGINSEGLRRRDFDTQAMSAIKQAYKTIYKSNLRLSQAIDQLGDTASKVPEVKLMVDFLAASSRGIIR